MKTDLCILVSSNYVVEQVLLFFENGPSYDTKINGIKTANALIIFAEKVFYESYVKWVNEKIFNCESNWPQWLRTCYLTEAYSVFIDRMLFEWQILLHNEKSRYKNNIIELGNQSPFLNNRFSRETKDGIRGINFLRNGVRKGYSLYYMTTMQKPRTEGKPV